MDNRIAFAVLTLLGNAIGLPSFLQGNTKKGIMTILSAIITLSVVGIINGIKGIFAAIKIFKMTDEEFAAANKADLEDAIVFFCKD